MTAKSDGRGTVGNPGAGSAKKDDRKARSARALRENLKKRKQQVKARETAKN
ncbi:MAG: hypothetical protein JJ900_02505 [Rhodospirillales bacterium]|nr:hypothetical protein [Rhodospirillales bacterium]MBO6785694.1 hypothetical protein [Rhodospirillales bacterium]